MGLPNEDEFKGGAARVKGEIKEKVGRFFENDELENEGKADQVKGAMREDFGRLKRDAKNAVNRAVADLGDADQETSRR